MSIAKIDQEIFTSSSGTKVSGGEVTINTMGADYVVVFILTIAHPYDVDVYTPRSGSFGPPLITYVKQFYQTGDINISGGGGGPALTGVQTHVHDSGGHEVPQSNALEIVVDLDPGHSSYMSYGVVSYSGVKSSYGHKCTIGDTTQTFAPEREQDLIISAFGGYHQDGAKEVIYGINQDEIISSIRSTDIRLGISSRVITNTDEVTEYGEFVNNPPNEHSVFTYGLRSSKRRIFNV